MSIVNLNPSLSPLASLSGGTPLPAVADGQDVANFNMIMASKPSTDTGSNAAATQEEIDMVIGNSIVLQVMQDTNRKITHQDD